MGLYVIIDYFKNNDINYLKTDFCFTTVTANEIQTVINERESYSPIGFAIQKCMWIY